MLTPHLHFRGDCAAAIALYEKAFGGRAQVYMTCADGSIGHAEFAIHGQRVMLNDNIEMMGKATGPTVGLWLSFSTAVDLEACFALLSDGGTELYPPAPEDWSECVAQCVDPFGVQWGLYLDKE